MAEIVKETVLTQNQGPKVGVTRETKSIASNTQTLEYLVFFILGILEVLLLARLLFRLLGANVGSLFVSFIYGITNIFVYPFVGIFRRGVTRGIETTAVFEPETVVAMIVYALVAWAIVKLVQIMSGERLEE